SVSIYPNPATTQIIINSPDLQIIKSELFDYTGRMLVQQQQGNNASVINTSSLSNGYYFIKIYTAKGNVIKNFIKN
ncbi:MAG: T9SS type A sorting domain-containing protein, partial [Bacteroidales bacterium]|nr:T9SS type A sorting domain-containing protein [Bacteroidales bacterium]